MSLLPQMVARFGRHRGWIRCAVAQVRVLDVVEAVDEIARARLRARSFPSSSRARGRRPDNALWMCCSTSRTADAVVGRRAHRAQQTVDDERRETERQLVDEQEAAPAGEAPSEREHLLLATRQQADAALEVRFELGEQRQRTVDVAPADAQVLARR